MDQGRESKRTGKGVDEYQIMPTGCFSRYLFTITTSAFLSEGFYIHEFSGFMFPSRLWEGQVALLRLVAIAR